MTAPFRVLIPLTLVALALFLAVFLQTIAALGGRSDLMAASTQQEQTYKDAIAFRDQLDGIAADTVKLANAGDPAAKAIVDALGRSGIVLPQEK